MGQTVRTVDRGYINYVGDKVAYSKLYDRSRKGDILNQTTIFQSDTNLLRLLYGRMFIMTQHLSRQENMKT